MRNNYCFVHKQNTSVCKMNDLVLNKHKGASVIQICLSNRIVTRGVSNFNSFTELRMHTQLKNEVVK